MHGAKKSPNFGKLKYELIGFRQNLYAMHRHKINHKKYPFHPVCMKKCGWIYCKKSFAKKGGCKCSTCKKNKVEDDGQKFYICNGCKLIYYCCRDHQKRDWKLIHSEQCKSIRKYSKKLTK